MNFINENKDSPHIDVLETIFYLIGFIVLVLVVSAIVGVIYALHDLCKPESLCALYQWFGGLL